MRRQDNGKRQKHNETYISLLMEEQAYVKMVRQDVTLPNTTLKLNLKEFLQEPKLH